MHDDSKVAMIASSRDRRSASGGMRARLMPPEITDIAHGTPDAKGNPTLMISGKWFGTKAPKVWREYVDAKTGAIKRQTMKILKPADANFTDAKGKPSCMNAETGASQVIVIVPTPPRGILNGTIVLDNGTGLAAGESPPPAGI